MKLQNRETWIEKMDNLVEEQLETSTKILQNLSEEALLFSESGEWSATACLAHLNSYTAYYLPRINKVMAKQKSLSETSFIKPSWIGSFFINMMKPTENGKKFKAMKKHLPNTQSLDAYQTVADFIQSLEAMTAILTQARFIDINKGNIGSSMSPLINLKPCDAIEFILVHNQRHLIQALKQVKKIQNDIFQLQIE